MASRDRQIIKNYLKSISEISNDLELSAIYLKGNIDHIEFKLFDQISYLLLRNAKQNVTGILWPVTDKKHHRIFITHLFTAIEQIKLDNCWIKFPNFQKSHFQDPRPENDKVLDFLIRLSSITVQLMTNTSSAESSTTEVENELQNLSEETDECTRRLESLKSELEEAQVKKEKLTVKLEKEERLLRDLDILEPQENFDLETLLLKQIELEHHLQGALEVMEKRKNSQT